MNRKLSFEERVHNAYATQVVSHYKALHCYYHGIGHDREEMDTLWLHSENSTWGHGFGVMIGIEEMYLNHIWNIERGSVNTLFGWQRKMPELIGHDLRSTGSSSAHALSSEVIEVADDGKSARSFYLTPGILANNIDAFDAENPEHRGNVYLWERYGSDFVFVDGEWKWFHEQVVPDIWCYYDHRDWAQEAYQQQLAGNVQDNAMAPAKLSNPNRRHKDYGTVVPVQRTAEPPVPYATLDDENTYSPGYTKPF